MDKKRVNLAIVESSPIILEGIQNIIQKSHLYTKSIIIKDIDNLGFHLNRLKIDIIFINPIQIVNRIKFFTSLKSTYPQMKWIGLTYSIIDKEVLPIFDEVIQIDDHNDLIIRKIEKFCSDTQVESTDLLTDREINVLKEIIKGHSNKEIAENLNISIHTVMSHRKNIYLKTEIKSQAGLTVFALTHNIVSIDSI